VKYRALWLVSSHCSAHYQCEELEQFERIGRMDLLYRKASQLTKAKKKSQNSQIRNKEGTLLTEVVQVQGRWKEYIEDFYDKDNKKAVLSQR